MSNRLTCVRQHDTTDCGPACLATICRYYGSYVPVTKLREYSGTNKSGTTVYGLVKAAEKMNFSVKVAKGNKRSLTSNIPFPAIAHFAYNSIIHYVVIYKVSKEALTVADPAKGIVKYNIDEFVQKWSGVLIFLVPDDNFIKTKKNGNAFLRFLKMLLPQKKLILNVFLLSLIVTALGIAASYYFMILMNNIIPINSFQLLQVVSLIVVLLTLVRAALEFLRNQLLVKLSQSLDVPLILGFYKHVLALPIGFFGTRKSGEIVSRFSDAARIRETISGATLTIMIDTIMAAAGGIILYFSNPLLFCLAAIIVIFNAVIVFAFKKPLEENNQEQMENNAQLTSFLVEGLNSIETVKAYNAEEIIHTRTSGYFTKFLQSISKGAKLNNRQQSLSRAVYSTGINLIIWLGALFVLRDRFTMGELITFNALLAYFIDPVRNLIGLQPMIQTASVAAERLEEVLLLETESKGDKSDYPNDVFRHGIEISDLCFRYGKQNLVLNNICMSIEHGQKIALVGESGSGKSTLVKLLMNFYKFEKGSIKFNGVDIDDIDLKFLRSKIAYIPQDIHIISGSVKDNLWLGNKDATLEDMQYACKQSMADDFISKMPFQYDTLLNENGSNLSGGQKQRLAIARAILKKPDILILDEATSNLDSITEKAIEEAVDMSFAGITMIIIAHRLSTIKNCDKIYVINNGRIVEEGTHAELIERKQEYYKLWNQQTLD